jgi:DDE superfamily endonuclease
MNAALFEDWVEKCLIPTLSQGDIVVMDNLPAHKGARVEQLIKSAGTELRYLPPCSYDTNDRSPALDPRRRAIYLSTIIPPPPARGVQWDVALALSETT